MMPRDDERGMILVNVLLFVAIASGLVLLMMNREELALDRALRSSDAAHALAIARGGETSAIVALRRDMADAPKADYAGEKWGALAESGAPIAGGSFDLAIADAQGRFNINNILDPDPAQLALFQQIARAAGLSDEQTLTAAALVRRYGPITDLRPIRLAGIAPGVTDRLEAMVTALPGTRTVNLNAATPALLDVIFRQPILVDRLVRVRKRQGFLTEKDLDDADVSMRPGTGFASDAFWVRTGATIGQTRQEEAALIVRDRTADGAPRAMTVQRWRNSAIPPDAPAFVRGQAR